MEMEAQEPTRVITVRLPKSLHEALRVEAHEHRTSMNKLCISKLLQIIDGQQVPGGTVERISIRSNGMNSVLQKRVRSGPISRVLYPRPIKDGVMAISLGSRLLGPSSGLPGSRRRAGPARGINRTHEAAGRIHCSLLDLAPGGVCLARLVAQPAGELLPHRFTLTARAFRKKGPRGGLLSVALSRALRPVGVTHHHVLRSPDFPPAPAASRPIWRPQAAGAGGHPVHSEPSTNIADTGSKEKGEGRREKGNDEGRNPNDEGMTKTK